MPSFCRHNRLVQNCPICAREQAVEMRPVVTPGGRPESRPRPATERAPASRSRGPAAPRAPRGSGRGGMTVRRLTRAADDGYASGLVPGVRSIADAERLAAELAFAATRVQVLELDPPGLYREVADAARPLEERTWLAFQIALCGPLDLSEAIDPFSGIERARRSWASGELPDLAEGRSGPRGGGDPVRGARCASAYRAWAQRAGSQAAAFGALGGEGAWTGPRRFDRVFERLGALAAMDRGVRYDLLVTLGALGAYELVGERLHVGGADTVTLAAKRILGIGDPLLLERRAADLAAAAALPVAALDLGFFNWERGHRFTGGLPAEVEPDPELLATARGALGLD